MSQFKNYDPGRIIFSWRGIDVIGFMDGTFIKAERNEDSFKADVGAGGDVTRVRSRNRTGKVTLTLQAASPTNDLFAAVAAQDELFGTGYGPLLGKDLNGTTVIQADVAWIMKPSDIEFAVESSGREWVLECAELELSAGGAIV